MLCGVGRRSHSYLCCFTSAVSLFSMQISKTTLVWPPVLSYYSNNIKKTAREPVCERPSDHHRKLAYRESREQAEESNCAFGRPGCLNKNLGTWQTSGITNEANNHEENVERSNRREKASLAAAAVVPSHNIRSPSPFPPLTRTQVLLLPASSKAACSPAADVHERTPSCGVSAVRAEN